MTDVTPETTAAAIRDPLPSLLRLHARELIDGGTNASDLRRNLFAAADLLDAQARQEATGDARVLALTKALEEVCIRIEASRKPGEAETHRELSAHRKRVLDAVYAVAESALAASSEPPATGEQ